MPEGTVFFSSEPVVRVTAPIIEANLLTAFLMNCVHFSTLFLSKFVRSIIAAKGKSVIGPGPQRTHGFEAGFKAQKYSYIGGGDEVPSPSVRRRFRIDKTKDIDPAIIAYHAYIKSFATEKEALEKASQYSKLPISVMVDTYDFDQGLENAVVFAKKLKKGGHNKLSSITIDSGDLYKLSIIARERLNQAGLKDVQIVLGGNLEEYKIKKLVDKKTPADVFLVGTEVGNSTDAPKLEVVYKLAEIRNKNKVEYKMKLAKGKKSLPGRKQVYRILRNNKFRCDIIGLESEDMGEPLLRPVFKKGKLVYKLPSLNRIRNYVRRQVKYLPSQYLSIDKQYKYPVKLSNQLKKLSAKVRKDILKQIL